MKLIAISTSPRKGQNTDKLLKVIVEQWQELGIDGEFITLAGKTITPCRGCSVCQTGRDCVIKDDITDILRKMQEADGIVIGSPTYFYDVNAQCKILIDRSYAVESLNGNKVAGIVSVAGSLGHSSSIKTLEMFYRVHGITNVGFLSVYSPVDDKVKALASAKALANKVHSAAKAMEQVEDGVFDAFNHFSYGTHTK